MRPVDFIKIVLEDWHVGALTISSPYVVRRVLQEIKPRYKYLVEYGAGEGVLTRAILRHLAPDGRMVAIERNPLLVRELQADKDPRLRVIHGDAFVLSGELEELGLPRIDAAISSIPLSFIAPDVRDKFIHTTYEALAPGGCLIVYQYSPLVLPFMKRLSPHVRVLFEPRNFLPYFIMMAEK